MNTIISIIIALIVAGFVLWAIRQILTLVPMEPWIKQVIDVLVLVAVVAIVVFYALIPLLRMLASQLHL
jgi:hypothetical protein